MDLEGGVDGRRVVVSVDVEDVIAVVDVDVVITVVERVVMGWGKTVDKVVGTTLVEVVLTDVDIVGGLNS